MNRTNNLNNSSSSSDSLLNLMQKLSTREEKVSLIKIILDRLPKILIYTNFFILAVLYVCTVTVSLPFLFLGGIVFALVFASRAISEFGRIFKNKSDSYEDSEILLELEPEKYLPLVAKIEKHNLFDFVALLILGLSLATLGITLLTVPAFLGMFLHLHVIFKISLIFFGALFINKSIAYFRLKFFRKKLGFITKNVTNILLYISGLALGIFSMITVGFLNPVPILFTTVFICRTVASVFCMFPESRMARDLTRIFESISLAIIGFALLIVGILFASAVTNLIGLSVLFTKSVSIVLGVLFLCSALAKIWIGSKLEEIDSEINLEMPLCSCTYCEYIASLRDRMPGMKESELFL